MSSVVENKKKCFCVSDAQRAKAYQSLEAWNNFCSSQELIPSILAENMAKKQPWWKDPEVTANAAGLLNPHQQKSLSDNLGDFYFCLQNYYKK